MSVARPETCGACGCALQMMTSPGRTSRYRDEKDLPIPEDVTFLTCCGCGDVWMNSEDITVLDAVLKPEYDKRKAEAMVKAVLSAAIDDVTFSQTISKAMDYLNVSDRELAEHFEFSVATITRWRSGYSAPHTLIRRTVYRHLAALFMR